MNRCPTCNSPRPHLHPAVQYEGEVHICVDDFHLTPTNQNRPSVIAQVQLERKVRAQHQHSGR
jgi:hypothetical protein